MKTQLLFAVVGAFCFAPFLQADDASHFTAPAEASANVFQAPQQAPRFEFHTSAGAGETKVTWSVQDWQGTTVSNRETALKDGGTLALPDLGPGYYQLLAKIGEQTLAPTPFAIIPTPGRLAKDSPYGLDSAQTSILFGTRKINPQQPKNDYEILARLIKLSGISMSRERLNWPGVLKPGGGYNWSAPDVPVNNLAKDGIPALNMFTQSPPATRGDLLSLPRDLLALYRFSKEAASHYQGKVVAWEFWNEPDDTFCLDSAWDFASAQKVAFAGFRAGNPQAKVLIGANATSPTPRFVELALQNGAGDFFDIYNFHTYASAGALPRIIAEKQALLKKYGLADKPMWVTEIGLQYEGMGGVSANIPGQPIREHSAEQEMQQARFLIHSMLTGQARGIERLFFFALPPYNEQNGGKVWGLLRWDWTVKPAYVALANLTAQLGSAKMLGNYDLAMGTVAYLFQRGDEQVLAMWADNPTEVEIPDGENRRVIDMMGHTQPFTGKTATIGPNPQFFTGFHGLQPIPALPKPAFPMPAAAPLDLKTVYSIHFLPGTKISHRTVADLDGDAARQAELIVTNLSDQPKKIRVANTSQGLKIDGLPETITAPPWKSTIVPFSLQLATEKTPLCYLRLGGQSEAGAISPLHVPVKPPGDALASARAVVLPATAPGSWISSASTVMTSRPSDEPGAMQFLAHFPAGTARWIYPKFDLQSRKISFAGSIGISFEIRLLQPSDPKQVNKAYLMVYTLQNGKGGNFQFPFRAVPAWNRVSYLWEQDAPNGFDPASAIGLKIGLNPIADDVAYEVRNVTVYYGDQAAP